MAGKLIEYPFDTVKVWRQLNMLNVGSFTNTAGWEASSVPRAVGLFPTDFST
jgi:hypothetical protein